jgi:hypothetical protein
MTSKEMIGMKTRLNLSVALLAGICLAGLTGCDPLTRKNYDMITLHVDGKPDVERMIGKPDHKLPSQWHYERVDKHLVVKVEFDQADLVTRKEWIDADAGEWDDTRSPSGENSDYESTTIRKFQN